jgi:hypothetical protein
MTTATLDQKKLKQDIILILEEDFDPHLQRVDDNSIQLLSIQDGENQAIKVKVHYQEIFIRCCAGPSWETPIQQTLTLIHDGKRWNKAY